jgi:hypothetical protein
MHLGIDLSLLRRRASGFTLDFSAARGVIPAPLTLTRASGAAFFNAGGTLVEVAADVARFGSEGLLVEGARTNMWADSQIAAGTGWTNGNISVTTTDGPDGGGASARRLDDGVATGTHRSEGPSFTSVVSAVYTMTAIVRAGTCTSCQLIGATSAFPSTVWANFDLTGDGVVGTFGATTTARIRRRGAWYECSISAPATIAAAGRHLQVFMTTSPTAARAESYAGTNRTLDVSQAWLEDAAFPSSPIIGTGGPINRAADVLTAPWASAAPSGEATILFLGVVPSGALGTRTLFSVWSDVNNRISLRSGASNQYQVVHVNAGVANISGGLGTNAGTDFIVRAGMTIAAGRVAAFQTGGTVQAVAQPRPVLTTFQIGARNLTNLDPGFLRGLVVCRVIPRAVSDADLQSLVNAL